MKKTKKNNKGFSLVELIVVVLIMAIIAVALAPQVMKWVNNSRVSSDVTSYETLVSDVQIALTDENTWKSCGDKSIAITITSTGASSNNTDLDAQLDKIAPSWKTKTKQKDSSFGKSYVISIENGAIDAALAVAPAGAKVE